MRTVVGEQFGRHRLELAGEEEVEEQGMDDIITMVAQRNLVGTEFPGGAINDAAAQAGAQRAGRLAFRDGVLDDRVSVLLDDPVVDPDLLQVSGQHLCREAGLLLVEVHGDQAEIDRRTLAKRHQHRQQGVGVLAAGDADQNGVAVLDHLVVGNRLADLAFQSFPQALQSV
ncbi:MAG: hypothetical protein AW12_03101 [Candidatus Accumulibacter sp. BA-94]|nr:MAG: hypothetical protein AW12_03101 [Candidatus Accumulibacter sp. BA-94]